MHCPISSIEGGELVILGVKLSPPIKNSAYASESVMNRLHFEVKRSIDGSAVSVRL